MPDKDREKYMPHSNHHTLPFKGNHRYICNGDPGGMKTGVHDLRKAQQSIFHGGVDQDPLAVGVCTLYLCEAPRIHDVFLGLRVSLVDPTFNKLSQTFPTINDRIRNWSTESRGALKYLDGFSKGLTDPELVTRCTSDLNTIQKILQMIRILQYGSYSEGIFKDIQEAHPDPVWQIKQYHTKKDKRTRKMKRQHEDVSIPEGEESCIDDAKDDCDFHSLGITGEVIKLQADANYQDRKHKNDKHKAGRTSLHVPKRHASSSLNHVATAPSNFMNEMRENEEDSDFNLAWKMTDFRRTIVEKNQDNTIETVNSFSDIVATFMGREDVDLGDYSILEHSVEDHHRTAEKNFCVSVVYELASKIGDAIPYSAKAVSLCKSRLQNLKGAKETNVELVITRLPDLVNRLNDAKETKIGPPRGLKWLPLLGIPQNRERGLKLHGMAYQIRPSKWFSLLGIPQERVLLRSNIQGPLQKGIKELNCPKREAYVAMVNQNQKISSEKWLDVSGVLKKINKFSRERWPPDKKHANVSKVCTKFVLRVLHWRK